MSAVNNNTLAKTIEEFLFEVLQLWPSTSIPIVIEYMRSWSVIIWCTDDQSLKVRKLEQNDSYYAYTPGPSTNIVNFIRNQEAVPTTRWMDYKKTLCGMYAASIVLDGFCYLFGGLRNASGDLTGTGLYTNNVTAVSLADGSRHQRAPMPMQGSTDSLCILKVEDSNGIEQNRVFLFAHQTKVNCNKEAALYDTKLDQWEILPPLLSQDKHAFTESRIVAFDNKAFIFSRFPMTTAFLIFDPKSRKTLTGWLFVDSAFEISEIVAIPSHGLIIFGACNKKEGMKAYLYRPSMNTLEELKTVLQDYLVVKAYYDATTQMVHALTHFEKSEFHDSFHYHHAISLDALLSGSAGWFIYHGTTFPQHSYSQFTFASVF